MRTFRSVLIKSIALLATLALFVSQPAVRVWALDAAETADEAELPDDEYAATQELPGDEYAATQELPGDSEPVPGEGISVSDEGEPVFDPLFKTAEVSLRCRNEYDLSELIPGTPPEGVRFYTDDREIASISKLGRIMTFEEGDCTVTAVYDNGRTESCIVHVMPDSNGRVRIALTFDDGPGKYSWDLMDFLESRGVKVTFFLVGNIVANYPNTVRRMVEDGHEVGNHTFSHVKLTTLEKKSEVSNEIKKCNSAIKKYTGFEPTIVRPPYGSHNTLVDDNVGLPMIRWSVDTRDWEVRDPVFVCEQIVNGATDGAIILCHETHPTTIEGAKMAIDILLAQGVEFMTVTDLLTEDGRTLEKGKLYSRR